MRSGHKPSLPSTVTQCGAANIQLMARTRASPCGASFFICVKAARRSLAAAASED